MQIPATATALACVLLSACDAASTPPESPARPAASAVADGFPRTVRDADGREVTVPARPRRILPATASAVDWLLVLVEPGRIAAISPISIEYSLGVRRLEEPWPEERTFGRYTVEGVLAVEPDLVITHPWQNPVVAGHVASSGIPVLALPEVHEFEDLDRVLEVLGAALGVEERAAEVAADLARRRAALAAAAPSGERRAIGYTNLGTGGSVPGAGTSYDLLLRLAGLVNVAAEDGIRGVGQVGHEDLLRWDPDWIVVGSTPQDPGRSVTEEFLRGEEALGSVRAVRDDRIVRLPAELYDTTSLYLVEAAEEVQRRMAGR